MTAPSKVLRRLEPSDVLVVTRLDRLARSTRDLLNVLAAVTERGAGFRSLKDTWADTTTPHGRLMLTVLGGLAEFERELIRARTGEGRERAKARGVRFGRLTATRRSASASRPQYSKKLPRFLRAMLRGAAGPILPNHAPVARPGNHWQCPEVTQRSRRSAASFSQRLMLPVSNDTLLRVVRRRGRLRRQQLNGIDDWAWRRNHRDTYADPG